MEERVIFLSFSFLKVGQKVSEEERGEKRAGLPTPLLL